METKDLQRIQDIQRKSEGVLAKAESLANHMAALIKDRDKAYRRFEAASRVFGNEHPVTSIFLRRWHILNGKILMETSVAAPIEQIEKAVEAAPQVDREVIWGENSEEGDPGINNARTAKGEREGILEIWETWTKEIIWVIQEGEKPRARSKTVANFQDENGEYLFGGRMLDWCKTEDREAAEKKWGKAEETRIYL